VEKTINRVSFFVWGDSSIKHMEETIQAFSNREIYDELKKKYGDSLVSIRKVWDYE
jgi:hypothetical protein